MTEDDMAAAQQLRAAISRRKAELADLYRQRAGFAAKMLADGERIADIARLLGVSPTAVGMAAGRYARTTKESGASDEVA